jgi:hypothetical protein
MNCPKCGTDVAEKATECPGCGIVLSKAADAMDRAYLRRQTLARQKSAQPEPVRSSKLPGLLIVAAVIAVCAFGAWQWYHDDTVSDLDKLAAEVQQADSSPREIDGGKATRWWWRRVAKFVVVLGVAAAGYQRLKMSLSP